MKRQAKQWVTVEVWAARKRRRKVVGLVLGAALLVGLIAADRAGLGLFDGGDRKKFDGRWAEVVRVVDGDTVDVAVEGVPGMTRVRLWGVDTPELGRDGEPAEPYAEKARAYLTKWLQGRRVRLVLEGHQTRGRYGRLLAHLETVSGVWVNQTLLRRGLARTDGRFSHSRMEQYEVAETDAERRGAGLWPSRSEQAMGRRSD